MRFWEGSLVPYINLPMPREWEYRALAGEMFGWTWIDHEAVIRMFPWLFDPKVRD